MALKLYRRHRKECEGGHPEDSRTGEFEESRRGWKRCGCLIHASGTINGKFNRKQTGKNSWEEAKAVAALWERTNWDGEIPASEPATPPEQPAGKTTIEKAIAAYLAERAEILAPNTQRQNKAILSKLYGFSESRGYVLVEQWTPLDVREFRASWGVAANTAAKNMATVKSFFGFCTDNDWIAKDPTKRVKGIRSKSNANERVPFTDEELKRMYDACETQYGRTPIRWSRNVHHQPAKGKVANYRYKWTGLDLADFISVSVYTGLRISDVATFHMDRLLASGECHVRTTKTGRKTFSKLDGNIGYLKVSILPGLLGLDVARQIDAAVMALANCERLILDLRGHLGGGLGVLRLMSHLTSAKLPIGYTVTRKMADRGHTKEQLRKLDHLPTEKPNPLAILSMALKFGGRDPSVVLVSEGLGMHKWHGRVVILTNEHTVSAGEMVCAFARENNLAKIVGTETAGRLIPGSGFKVGHGYMVIMPKAAYITWEGQRFEGRGIQPDVCVPWSPEAYAAGRDNQLECGMETIRGL